LGVFLATINSRDIGFNSISSEVLKVVLYIQGQIWQFKILAENSVVRKMGILSCDVKGFLNDVTRKSGTQGALNIRILWGWNHCVWSMVRREHVIINIIGVQGGVRACMDKVVQVSLEDTRCDNISRASSIR
jgi:RNase P/RNase MRP subunit POP5